jgi:hypothetical protein
MNFIVLLADRTWHILIAGSVLFICLDTIFLMLRFYPGKLHKTLVEMDDLVTLLISLTLVCVS